MSSLFRSDTPLGRVLSRPTTQRPSSPSLPPSTTTATTTTTSPPLHPLREISEKTRDNNSSQQQRRRTSSTSSKQTVSRAQASAWSSATFFTPLPPPSSSLSSINSSSSSSSSLPSTTRNSMQSDSNRPVSPTHTRSQPQVQRSQADGPFWRGEAGSDELGTQENTHDNGGGPASSSSPRMTDRDQPAAKRQDHRVGTSLCPIDHQSKQEHLTQEEHGVAREATPGGDDQHHHHRHHHHQHHHKHIVWDQSTDAHPKRQRRRSHHRVQTTTHEEQPKDTYTLSDRTSIVLETRGDIPPRLIGASTTVFARRMYVFGGLNKEQSLSRPSNHLYILNLDTMVWTKHLPHAHSQENNHRHQQEQKQHNDETRTWPKPRYFHSAIVVPSPPIIGPHGEFHGYGQEEEAHLVVFGGRDESGCMNDTHLLDLNTLTWVPDTGLYSPTAVAPSPSPEAIHTSAAEMAPSTSELLPSATTTTTPFNSGTDVGSAVRQGIAATAPAEQHSPPGGANDSPGSLSMAPNRSPKPLQLLPSSPAARSTAVAQTAVSHGTNNSTPYEPATPNQPVQAHLLKRNPFRFHRPTPRCGHLVSLSGDFMVVFGGRDEKQQYIQEISVLDLHRRVWVLGGHFHRPCNDDRSILVHVDEQALARRRRRYREAFERDAVLRRLSIPPSSAAMTMSLSSSTTMLSPTRASVEFSSRRPSNAGEMVVTSATSPTSPTVKRLSQPLLQAPLNPHAAPHADNADLSSKLIPFLNPRKDSWYQGEGEPFNYSNLGAALLDHLPPAQPPRPPSKFSPLSPLARMDSSSSVAGLSRRRAMSELADQSRLLQRPSLDLSSQPALDMVGLSISPTSTMSTDLTSLWSASTSATTWHDISQLMTRNNSISNASAKADPLTSAPLPRPSPTLRTHSVPIESSVERKASIGRSSTSSTKSGRSASSLRSSKTTSHGSNTKPSTASPTNAPPAAMSSMFMNKYSGSRSGAMFDLDDLATAYARSHQRAATSGSHQQKHSSGKRTSGSPARPSDGTLRRPSAASTGSGSPGTVKSPTGSNLPSRVRNVHSSGGAQPSSLVRKVTDNRNSREVSDPAPREGMEAQGDKGQQQGNATFSSPSAPNAAGGTKSPSVGNSANAKASSLSLSSATASDTGTSGAFSSTSNSKPIPVSSQPVAKMTKPTLYLYSNTDMRDPEHPHHQQVHQQNRQKRSRKDRDRASGAVDDATKVHREFIKIQPATHARATTGLLLAGKIMFDIDNEWAGLDEVVAGGGEHGLPPRLYYPMGHVVDGFLLMSGRVHPKNAPAPAPTSPIGAEGAARDHVTENATGVPLDGDSSDQQNPQEQKANEASATIPSDTFAIWRHNLVTHEWTRLEISKSLSNGRWHRSVLDPMANMLYVLGRENTPVAVSDSLHDMRDVQNGSIDEDSRATISPDSHDSALDASAAPELYFDHVVEVDLEGLDMPQGIDEASIGPLGIQMGLEMLRDGVASDCVLVSAIDGGRVRVNSAMVGQRWGYFQSLIKDYERAREMEARERMHSYMHMFKQGEENDESSGSEASVTATDENDGGKATGGFAHSHRLPNKHKNKEHHHDTHTHTHTHEQDCHPQSHHGRHDHRKARRCSAARNVQTRQWYLSDQMPELLVPETTPILVAFLQYVYTNTLSTPHQLKLKTLQGLLVLAHSYSLSRLRQLCLWAIQKHHLTAANALSICETATLTHEFGLQTRALRVLLQAARLTELRRQSEANEYRKRLEFAVSRMQAIEEDRRRVVAQQAQREAWQHGMVLSPEELLAVTNASASTPSDSASVITGARAGDRVRSPAPGDGPSVSSGSKKSPLSSPSNLSTVERSTPNPSQQYTSFVSRLFKGKEIESHIAQAASMDPTAAATMLSAAGISGDPLQHTSTHRRTLPIGAVFHSLSHHHHHGHHHQHHSGHCHGQQQCQEGHHQQHQHSQQHQHHQHQLHQQQEKSQASPHVLTVHGPAAPAKPVSPQHLELAIRPEDAEKWMSLVSKIQQGEPLPRLSVLGLVDHGEGDGEGARGSDGTSGSSSDSTGSISGSTSGSGSSGRGRSNVKRSTESMLLVDAEKEETELDDALVEEDKGEEEEEKEEEEGEEEFTQGVQQQSVEPIDELVAGLNAQRLRVASHDDPKRHNNRSGSSASSTSSSTGSSKPSHLRSKSLHHLASVVTAAMTGTSRRGASNSSSSKEKKGSRRLSIVEDENSVLSSTSSNVSSLSLASSTGSRSLSRASSTASHKGGPQHDQQQQRGEHRRTESTSNIDSRELAASSSTHSGSSLSSLTNGLAATAAAMPPLPPSSAQQDGDESRRNHPQHSFHLSLSSASPFLSHSSSNLSLNASTTGSSLALSGLGSGDSSQQHLPSSGGGEPSFSWLSFRSSSVPTTPTGGIQIPKTETTVIGDLSQAAAAAAEEVMHTQHLQLQNQQQLQLQQTQEEPLDYFRPSHYTTDAGSGHVELAVSTPTPTMAQPASPFVRHE